MAEQVRPGLTDPARFKGPQQSADLIRRQPAHSIRARGQAPFTEAECMAAISTCFRPEPKDAWQPGGRPCMNLRVINEIDEWLGARPWAPICSEISVLAGGREKTLFTEIAGIGYTAGPGSPSRTSWISVGLSPAPHRLALCLTR